MEQFRISVPDSDLADLQARLARTRFARTTPGEPWSAGVPPEYLREVVDYWQSGFDWRAQEARLNAYPQFIADVQGERVHFVHVRSSDPDARAIILVHGWPYSFIEMLKLADELRDFHVVIPSLPGYGYSDASALPFTDENVARSFHTIMTVELGYESYLTYGEDVGTGVSDRLAADYAGVVAGIFASHPPYVSVDKRHDLEPAETAFFDWLDERWSGERGYSEEQSTKPDTLAAGLSDSPAGLAAWMLEKFHRWSDRESRGETLTLDEKFSRDDLLTTISLYWFTNSIGSSFRPYFDWHRDEKGLITVPAGVAVSLADEGYPRELADRSYSNVQYFTALPHGGHFVAFEEPELVAGALREFVAASTLTE